VKSVALFAAQERLTMSDQKKPIQENELDRVSGGTGTHPVEPMPIRPTPPTHPEPIPPTPGHPTNPAG
jgi:hypothetical protein